MRTRFHIQAVCLLASISLTIILICGALSLAALFLYKSFSVARVMKYVVLLFAFASAATMARTAHLGGQIRHTEIQSTVMASNDKENGSGENAKQEKGSEKKETKDDDD